MMEVTEISVNLFKTTRRNAKEDGRLEITTVHQNGPNILIKLIYFIDEMKLFRIQATYAVESRRRGIPLPAERTINLYFMQLISRTFNYGRAASREQPAEKRFIMSEIN